MTEAVHAAMKRRIVVSGNLGHEEMQLNDDSSPSPVSRAYVSETVDSSHI